MQIIFATWTSRFSLEDVTSRGFHRLIEMAERLNADAAVVTQQTDIAFLPQGEGESRPYSPPIQVGVKRPEIPERLRFLEAQKPREILEGVQRNKDQHRYLAFVFDKVVLVECAHFGNALYAFVNHPGWQLLAATDKTTLIKQKPDGFLRRFCHRGTWQQRVLDIVLG